MKSTKTIKHVVLPNNRQTRIQLEGNNLYFVTTTEKSSDTQNLTYHVWDLSEQLDIKYVLEQPGFEDYRKVAKVVKNDKKACGYEIQVEECFSDKKFVIYLIVVNGKVIKGGKSKNELRSRSYGAGTEKSWSESGKASPTNYVFSQIFRQCLEDGVEVEFYATSCAEPIRETRNWYGKDVVVDFSPYEEQEKAQNAYLNELLGRKVIGEGDLLSESKK